MTEFWKSQTNYFCEYCRVWLKDTVQSRATHERGTKHRENVAKRITDMQRRGVQEERDAKHAAAVIEKIEVTAAASYKKDQEREAEERSARLGTWELQPASGFKYNAVQRWYYDPASTQYYGGDPPTWTTDPPIPKEARCEVVHAPDEANSEKRAGTLAASTSESLPKTGATHKGRALFKPETIAHPLSQVGGHQMPREGRIGGAKGAGSLGGVVISDVGKRKQPEATAQAKDKDKAPVSREEAEFLARREAARQRVQQRTMSSFGLQ